MDADRMLAARVLLVFYNQDWIFLVSQILWAWSSVLIINIWMINVIVPNVSRWSGPIVTSDSRAHYKCRGVLGSLVGSMYVVGSM